MHPASRVPLDRKIEGDCWKSGENGVAYRILGTYTAMRRATTPIKKRGLAPAEYATNAFS